MSFLAVLFALVIEQARPLARGSWIHAGLRAWARWCSRSFDAGQPHHGWIAWTIAVFAPSLLTLLIHVLLWRVSVVLAFIWNVAILYLTLGFRQFSHHFTAIRDALDDGDEALARALLAKWRRADPGDLARSEILRHVIEHSVLAAHRHVFGVLGWFSVLAALGLGPAGAVMYRMAEFLCRYWLHRDAMAAGPAEEASPSLQASAGTAWGGIDFIPARATSLGFAVVGSFEDSIDAWRNYSQRTPSGVSPASESRNDGTILAATSGAVNVRLGARRPSLTRPAGSPYWPAPGLEGPDALRAAESIPGREPEPAHLRSIVGLLWRSVVLWMLLLALLTLARLLG